MLYCNSWSTVDCLDVSSSILSPFPLIFSCLAMIPFLSSRRRFLFFRSGDVSLLPLFPFFPVSFLLSDLPFPLYSLSQVSLVVLPFPFRSSLSLPSDASSLEIPLLRPIDAHGAWRSPVDLLTSRSVDFSVQRPRSRARPSPPEEPEDRRRRIASQHLRATRDR